MENFSGEWGMTMISRGEHEFGCPSFLLQPRRGHPSFDVHDQLRAFGQHGLLPVSPLLLCNNGGSCH